MKNCRSTGLIQLTAICLAFAVLVSSSTFALAAPGARPMSAEIIVSGSNDNSVKPLVLLNGEQAISGRTFHSSGVVVTSEFGSAIINLGKLGRISLSPGSTLALSFAENNISGELSAGHMQVLNSEGVSVNIRTPDNVVTNDAAQSGNFTVDVRSGATQALVENGAAFLNNKPVQQKDDDDDDDKAGAVLLFTFIGVVATAVVLTMVLGNEENVTSPVR